MLYENFNSSINSIRSILVYKKGRFGFRGLHFEFVQLEILTFKILIKSLTLINVREKCTQMKILLA